MQLFENGAPNLPTPHHGERVERANGQLADVSFSRHFGSVISDIQLSETVVPTVQTDQQDVLSNEASPAEAKTDEHIQQVPAMAEQEKKTTTAPHTAADHSAAEKDGTLPLDAPANASLATSARDADKQNVGYKPSPISAVVQGLSTTQVSKTDDRGAQITAHNTSPRITDVPVEGPKTRHTYVADVEHVTNKMNVAVTDQAASQQRSGANLPVKQAMAAGRLKLQLQPSPANASGQAQGQPSAQHHPVGAHWQNGTYPAKAPTGATSLQTADPENTKTQLQAPGVLAREKHRLAEATPQTRTVDRHFAEFQPARGSQVIEMVQARNTAPMTAVTPDVLTANMKSPTRVMMAGDALHRPTVQTDVAQIADDVVWDLRPGTTHPTTTMTAQLQRAELPPPILHAIAEAFRKAPDKPIEIALNPTELGRVRLVMTTLETGMTVTITADRADTLDLMRRTIDDLGKSLNALGYEDVSFSFQGGQNRSDGADKQLEDGAQARSVPLDDVADPQHATPKHTPARLNAPAGIDMRF